VVMVVALHLATTAPAAAAVLAEGPMKAIKSRMIRLGLAGNEHAASIATERPSSLTGKLWREAMSDSQLSRLRGTVRVRAQHQIGNDLYGPPSSSIAGWDPPRWSTQCQFPRPAC